MYIFVFIVLRFCLIIATHVEDRFRASQIVPNVIPIPPGNFLSVNFPNGVQANLGNILTPTMVRQTPMVSWPYEPSTLYTLVITDPDVPSRANNTLAQFKHWLVANIPGNNVDRGDSLAQYIPPGPPANTGLHRYVFLVYQQVGRIMDPERLGFSADNRSNWNVAQFASQHYLGNPVAGNFYQAAWDTSVPALHKQLGMTL